MSQHKKSERWTSLNEELRQTMQQEVSLMRELLANLHQEEVSLMLQDHGAYHSLVQQKSEMVERLSRLRLFREKTIAHICEILGPKQNRFEPEQILPDSDEISCEIINLRDQIVALREKMSRQLSRNEHLTEHPEHLLSLHHQEKARQQKIRAKRKPIVATYHIKK